MKSDIPAIGPFPEIKLSEVPADSILLKDKGVVVPVEIGFYTINDQNKVTKIEYTGELGDTSMSNCMSHNPPVGPPLIYGLAGKVLGPPPS